MYFPILRGKQYELIALREASKKFSDSILINPVIEPVKSDTKGLLVACKELVKSNISFCLIINPSVGEVKNYNILVDFINESEEIKNYDKFQIGIHCRSQNEINKILRTISDNNLNHVSLGLFHDEVLDEEFAIQKLTNNRVKYNFFDWNKIRARRYRRLFDPITRVSIEDPFNLQNRNVEYINIEDEFFSDEYNNYKDEGNAGFGDYLTIGEQFIEGGFLPYAVAIHLTYEGTNNTIRIRHFVSDSNEDISDTPGKFSEALNKLVLFANGLEYKTEAINKFIEMNREGNYPGLGTIKKLSILNHIELVNRLIS